MSNIVLIGMRGSGKTTTAKLLAERLGKSFVETDVMISAKIGKSIPEIIAEKGWDYFRERESEVVKEVSRHDNEVVSTGGGAILKPENVHALKQNGVCIFLRASIDELMRRIGEGTDRPALTSQETMRGELEQLWNERKDLYEQTADIVIDTEKLTPSEVVDKIAERLHS